MPWRDTRSAMPGQAEDIFDDGGSGLFDACAARFSRLGWDITCDRNHAVWVKGPNSSYSVGLAPWVLGRYPLERILDHVESKVRSAEEAERSRL